MAFHSLRDSNIFELLLTHPLHGVTPVIHGTFNAVRARKSLDPRRENHPLYNFLMPFLTAVAGSIMMGLILGKKLAWWSDKSFIPIILLVIYLTFYAPFDFYMKIASFAPVAALIDLFEVLLVVRSCVTHFEFARTSTGGNLWAMVICGVLSACSGKLLLNLEMRLRSRKALTEFSKPTWSIRRSFYSTVFYQIGTNVSVFTKRFTPSQVQQAILIFFLSSAVATTVLGRDVDPLEWLEKVIYRLFFYLESAESPEYIEKTEPVEKKHHKHSSDKKEKKAKKEKKSKASSGKAKVHEEIADEGEGIKMD